MKKVTVCDLARFREHVPLPSPPPISIAKISSQLVVCEYTINYLVQQEINFQTNSVLEEFSSKVAEHRISMTSNPMNRRIPQ